jgi:hypothetical protein
LLTAADDSGLELQSRTRHPVEDQDRMTAWVTLLEHPERAAVVGADVVLH